MALTDEQFEQLARTNRDVRLERTANGELILMPPTGGQTGNRNLDISGQLWAWNRTAKLGVAFDSSTGFRLPNGATRSSYGGAVRTPDAAWVRQERWDTLSSDDRKRFPPLCPDFVIELCSESDDWPVLQAKMREYVENGLQLGWLNRPENRAGGDLSGRSPAGNPEKPGYTVRRGGSSGLYAGFIQNLAVRIAEIPNLNHNLIKCKNSLPINRTELRWRAIT